MVEPSTRRVFAQYLNPEILRAYGASRRFSQDAVLNRALLTTRYAALVTQQDIILPRSYLHEVPFIDAFLQRSAPLRRAGLISLASDTADPSEYLPRKRREYRGELALFDAYGEREPDELLVDLQWAPRMQRSTVADIAADWRAELAPGGVWDRLLGGGARPGVNRLPSLLESAIDDLPERLDGQAFIMRFVEPLLPVTPRGGDRTRVELLLSRAYLSSYLREYGALILTETALGELSCGLPARAADGRLQIASVSKVAAVFEALGIRDAVERRLTLPTLLQLRGEPVTQLVMDAILDDSPPGRSAFLSSILRARGAQPRPTRSRLLPGVLDALWRLYEALQSDSVVPPAPYQPAPRRKPRGSSLALWTPMSHTASNDVFLVCGRDARANRGMKEMLRAASITPVQWEEAVAWTGSTAPYVLDVLDAAFARVQAVLVLFTPDETVELLPELRRAHDPDHERRPGLQARPNVLVEAGMALALHPSRTLIIEIPPLRPLSDLEGLHTVRFDGSPAARQAVMTRLQTAGCTPRGSDYLTAGFEYLVRASGAAPAA